jgi:hypothetical protein
MALNPSITWETQKKTVRRKLIPAIVEELPRYKENRSDIQKILKQHHKTQRRTRKINSDPTLKHYNRARMSRNARINEVCIGWYVDSPFMFTWLTFLSD